MIGWTLDSATATDDVQALRQWAVAQLERLEPLVNQRTWDDLRAPASTLKKGSSAPSMNTTYGWLEFAHNADNDVFCQFQLPHVFHPGSTLKPHIHWMKTTAAAGEVEWQFQYRWAKLGEVLDGAWTTLSNLTPVIPDSDTQYKHVVTTLGDITTDGIQISDMLICQITRLGSSYSGGDHYGAAAVLLEVDIHYLRSSMSRGSSKEYIK